MNGNGKTCRDCKFLRHDKYNDIFRCGYHSDQTTSMAVSACHAFVEQQPQWKYATPLQFCRCGEALCADEQRSGWCSGCDDMRQHIRQDAQRDLED